MNRFGKHDDFAGFLSRHLPGKVQKISVNTSLSCPNRDGSKGRGGCTYCNNRSFSPSYSTAPARITEQLEEGKRFFARKYPHMKYLAYFQSYTATNAATQRLMEMFREALEVPDVVGLAIGTRPDCMPADLLHELQSLSRDKFVMVEYGAETACDDTLTLVNRCHTWADTADAVRRTHEAGIPVGLHLIMGLPGEDTDTMLTTIDEVNRLPVDIVKCHQLQLVRGTRLAAQVADGSVDYTPWELDDYIDLCCKIVDRLRDDIAIERFVSQSPDNLLISPRWGLKNYQFADRLRAQLRNLSQE